MSKEEEDYMDILHEQAELIKTTVLAPALSKHDWFCVEINKAGHVIGAPTKAAGPP